MEVMSKALNKEMEGLVLRRGGRTGLLSKLHG